MDKITRVPQQTKITITYGKYDTRWWRLKQLVRWIWTGKAELKDYY